MSEETNEETKICSNCGKIIEEEDWFNICDDGPLCQDCYDDNYFTCEHCGEVHHSDDLCTVIDARGNEQTWCRECADADSHTCAHCENDFTRDAMEVISRDLCLCEECFQHNYIRCEGCGDIIRYDDAMYCDRDECTYCENCYPGDDDDNDSQHIHDYNYKPRPFFHGKDPLFLGVELEIECSDRKETAESIHDSDMHEQRFYLKSDGSLNNGIEIVTHPCDLEYHKTDFGWSEILDTARKEGSTSHDASTCGLHVHLSRDFFTESEIVRFVAFVNIQSEYLKILARRDGERWCKFKDLSKGTKNLVTQAARYEAVNMYNAATLEVRIFKGTLKLPTLLACIESCDAIARFVKTSNIAAIVGKPEASWIDFCKFVQADVKTYSNLVDFMTRKNMMKEK